MAVTLIANDIVPFRGIDMAERRDGAEHAGIADENIELAPALVDRGAEPVERGIVFEVAGDERRLASLRRG